MTSPELANMANERNFIQRLLEVERRLKLVEGQAIGADQLPDLTEHMLINGAVGLGNLDTEPEAPGPGDNSGMYSIGNIYQKDYLLKYKNGWGADMGLTGFANPGLTQCFAVTSMALNAPVPIGVGAVTESGTSTSRNLTKSQERSILYTTGAVAGNGAGFYTPIVGYTGKIKRIAGRIDITLGESYFYFGLFDKAPYSSLSNLFAIGISSDPAYAGVDANDLALFVQTGNLIKYSPFVDGATIGLGISIGFEIYVDLVNRRVSAFAWPCYSFSELTGSYTKAIATAVIDNVTLDFAKAARFYAITYTHENVAKTFDFIGAYVEFGNENKVEGDVVTLSWDTYLNSGAAGTNYKANASLIIGEANTSVYTYRSLIKYALDTFAYINKPPRVGEAVLNLYLNADYSSNARRFSVYRMKTAMTADATWNTYDGANAWTAPGGFDAADCEQTEIGSINLTAAEASGWIQIPLDAVKIEEMINGTFANNGFLIRCDTETNDAYGFSSKEGANVPYLTVYEV